MSLTFFVPNALRQVLKLVCDSFYIDRFCFDFWFFDRASEGENMQSSDVIIIGADCLELALLYIFAQRCPKRRFLILEVDDAIGGTWDSFSISRNSF